MFLVYFLLLSYILQVFYKNEEKKILSFLRSRLLKISFDIEKCVKSLRTSVIQKSHDIVSGIETIHILMHNQDFYLGFQTGIP